MLAALHGSHAKRQGASSTSEASDTHSVCTRHQSRQTAPTPSTSSCDRWEDACSAPVVKGAEQRARGTRLCHAQPLGRRARLLQLRRQRCVLRSQRGCARSAGLSIFQCPLASTGALYLN